MDYEYKVKEKCGMPYVVVGEKPKGIPLEKWFPWFLSDLIIWNTWLMGNKSIWGPIHGILIQIPWIWYSLKTKQEGIILGALAIALVQVRNLTLWVK